MGIKDPIIFSTSSYDFLKKSLCQKNNFSEAFIENKVFPDGERYSKIITDVSNRNVIFIGGAISDSDTLDIYDISCAISKYGAKTLTLIIPYYAYSTMERAVKKGEVVKAKTRARLFSSIPSAYQGNRIVLVDLHAEGIPHYFESSIHTFHLYAKSIIIESIKELSKEDDFILASTDAGRAKWVESLSNDLNVKPAFVYKKRLSGDETVVSGISAEVKNKQVIIYDDMIRTGSSLINATKAYLDAGAKSVSCVTTHGIFPNDSLDKLEKSGLLEKIICTDTYPNVLNLESNFLKVKSIYPIISDFLSDKSNAYLN